MFSESETGYQSIEISFLDTMIIQDNFKMERKLKQSGTTVTKIMDR